MHQLKGTSFYYYCTIHTQKLLHALFVSCVNMPAENSLALKSHETALCISRLHCVSNLPSWHNTWLAALEVQDHLTGNLLCKAKHRSLGSSSLAFYARSSPTLHVDRRGQWNRTTHPWIAAFYLHPLKRCTRSSEFFLNVLPFHLVSASSVSNASCPPLPIRHQRE